MNRPPVETALANLHLDVTMATSDWISDVRGVDLEVALAYVDELRTENHRAADEIDLLNTSLDDARTDWHDLAAERDQARQIARRLLEDLGGCAPKGMPDWLTENGDAK